MKLIGRINNNLLNSQRMQTMRELEKLFQVLPNMPAKTIRLYPQNSLSFFTEGLGEIYNISEKSTNFIALNDRKYSWKIRGHQVPKIKFVTRVTGGAIAAGGQLGANGQEFVVAFGSSYYNPRDIVKLEDGTLIYILTSGVFIKEGTFEYRCKVNTNNPAEYVNTNLLQPGKTTGIAGVAYPEMSDKGYIGTAMAMEEHVNYLTKVRYDWSWSAEAAATKYLITDTVNYKGESRTYSLITDQLLMNAMEQYHHNKEMSYIYGRSTMDAFGRCFLQDEKGQDIVEGDGIIAQMADSCKQSYTNLTISLLEDVLTDMSLRMPKRTGNTIMLTTGVQGNKQFQRIMRAEHKGFWSAAPEGSYVTSRNGKIHLGREYKSYEFNGNTIIIAVNNVFDHPANVSGLDSEGKFLESSKLLFIDMSSYDGVQNIQTIAKDGRSFIINDLEGVGGMDGKTSGKVSTGLEGSSKIITGTAGIVMHNPYSSVMLERL